MLTKPKPGFRINYAHPLSRGLVGWWLMNEGGGPIAFDYSGNGNHGTLTGGPVWTGSPLGGSIEFDGVDDYITAPASFPISADMTIAVWVNRRTGGTGASDFFNYAVDSQNGIALRLEQITDLDDIEFAVEYQNTGFAVELELGNRRNQWQHLAGVFSGGDTVRLYIDGIDVDAGNSTEVVNGTNGNVRIGRDTGGNFFSGLIDDARIYNRALSATEIQQLYSNPYSLVLRQNTARTQFNGSIVGPTPGHGYQHQNLSLNRIGFKRSWSN